MTEELEEAFKKARSIDEKNSIEKMVFLGKVQKGSRIYGLYKDKEGAYRYKTRILMEEGWVTEYEAIFHKKYSKRRK